MSKLAEPLRSRSFRRLAVGKSVSFLGDWLMVAVLVGWVYRSTSSVAQVALLMAIRLVPPIVGGGLAASVVDRLPRLRVLIWSEVVCAGAIVGALAGVAVDSRAVVFGAVALCSLVATISATAGNALIPSTVDESRLAAANSIHSVGQEAAMALGALIGGLTLAAGGPIAGLAANLASYVVAVLLYAGIRDVAAPPAARARVRGALRDGFRYVAGNRPVAVVVGCFAIVTFSAGLVNATLPKFTSDLGLGAGAYGITLAVLALGMMVGELLTGAFAARIDARWLGAALAAMGFLGLAFAWSNGPFAALVLFGAFGVANGVAEVVMMTAIHEQAEAGYQGRVFGLGATLWRSSMLGAVALAPLVDAIASPSQAIGVAATLLLAGGVVVHAALRPARQPAPAPA
ncbi:MAG TPA: MFS transporter [Gaiellaceae bacterium]|nr:MFS transporter [Gaiellaceae bacterium]